MSDPRYRLATLLEPARTVGGDFCDWFALDEDRVFVAVGDVSGKGDPASRFMQATLAQLRAAAPRCDGVGEALTLVQREIERSNPDQLFVTVFAACLDASTGELACANAGHLPPFACAPGMAPERLAAPGGPALGVIDGFSYPTVHRRLVPGEWVCVVTDGATEAMNPRREFFGAERVRRLLGAMSDDPDPGTVIERVCAGLATFEEGADRADDLALLVLRWNG